MFKIEEVLDRAINALPAIDKVLANSALVRQDHHLLVNALNDINEVLRYCKSNLPSDDVEKY
jgi:hypothetical protein